MTVMLIHRIRSTRPRSAGHARLGAALTVFLIVTGLLVAAVPVPADFTVTAPADGSEFRLSGARGRYVALHFLLKTECPICLRHTRDYARRGPGLTNVVQVFLKPDSEEEIRRWTSTMDAGDPIKVTVYRDPEAALADAYGIPGGYAFHGQKVHYPALILLDPAGKEVFRHVGTNNSDRLPFDRFAAVVKDRKTDAPPEP
ncbi:MAG: redoxin domain-containing protein [Verrucomicrobia bacterium]|nr:redoxin domain-containing protein [Verrucomicrobiota bacterium]